MGPCSQHRRGGPTGRTIPHMIELIRANRTVFADRVFDRVVNTIPHYSQVDQAELRRSVDALVGDLIGLLEGASFDALKERIAKISRQRLEQGFSLSDFLQ